MTRDSVFVGRVEGELNPAYTLGAALIGTALVVVALLYAFSRALSPPVASARMLLRIVQDSVAVPVSAAAKPRTPQRGASLGMPSVQSLLPPFTAKPLPNLLPPAPSRLDLSMGLPSPTQPLPVASGPHAFNPYSDLERALKAPPEPATMENNSSFRSIYGFPVSKVGGVCSYSVPIEHLSLSPSVHPHVAFVVPCPGSYRPSMAAELKAWAEKQKKKLDGNGSG